jgi:hypothetical protein
MGERYHKRQPAGTAPATAPAGTDPAAARRAEAETARIFLVLRIGLARKGGAAAAMLTFIECFTTCSHYPEVSGRRSETARNSDVIVI